MSERTTICELSTRSNCAALAEVRAQVRRITADEGFDEETVGQIALVVDEALANVINHGYEGKEDQPIDLGFFRVHGEAGLGLEITVRDFGRQVDPATIRSRDLEEVRPGGLGVHIIQSVMDDVRYDRPTDGGMLLTMIRWHNRPSASATSP